MKKTGFYIIKDKFFEDMPDPYLKGNKAGNRPHYYCFEDSVPSRVMRKNVYRLWLNEHVRFFL